MENLDNDTIIKNINEFRLLLSTQKQYVLNTQHEIKYKEEEIKRLQDKIKKNMYKKKKKK